MAEPLTKKIDDLPEMDVVAASNDKLLMLDVSESAVNMTKLVPMKYLSIHTSSQLAANVVTTAGIANGAVTNSKLGADAVNGAKIADNAIGNEHIRDSEALSVIGRSSNSSGNPADIAAGTDGHVLRRSGTTLGFGTIATAGIADGAVTNSKLATDAVETAKIKNLNVTTGKLADNAVSNTKLRDSGAMSVIGRSANSTGDPADITAGTDGYVLRRSGTTLGFGTIATAGIADGAVTNSKLATDAVETAKIKNLNVTTGKIADNAITYAKLQQEGSVGVIGRNTEGAGNHALIIPTNAGQVLRMNDAWNKLEFSQVSTIGIADNAITEAKLATNAVTEAKLGAIKRTVAIPVFGREDAVIAKNFTRIMAWAPMLNGHVVVGASAVLLGAVSSSGAVAMTLTNQNGTMATISIAQGAWSASAASIDTTYDEAASFATFSINVTSAGSGAKGLTVYLEVLG